MISTGDRICVVAGSGQLPIHIVRGLSRAGMKPYIAALSGTADPALDNPRWETVWYDPLSLQPLLDGMKKAGIKRAVLAGRVGHDEIYRKGEFDRLLAEFLKNLKDRRPATILGGLVELFMKHGIEVLPITETVPDLLPAAGQIAGPPIHPGQASDILFGWKIARAVADLDIGQTVVVRAGAVVAVEAMEGTDRTIERAGKMPGGEMTVVKLAASSHDFRFDIPTVGPDTIQRLADSGGGLIAVEAGRSLLLEAERVSALCDEKGIPLISACETPGGGINWP